MESDLLAVVLIVLAALIPVSIILLTLKYFRRKRAKGEERLENKTFESVKEERLRKRGDY